MNQSALKPCPYRKARLGDLVCTVNQGEAKSASVEVCSQCPIPDVVPQVNCVNLSAGTTLIPVVGGVIHRGASFDCEVVGFARPEDYREKCPACPQRIPIHLSLVDEPPANIPGWSSAGKTDRELRQAVLAVLYEFHARHPDRYGRFDVTPEYVAASLGLRVTDVVRVVAPMEEEGEVQTLRYAGARHFQYVTITSRGIRAIDDAPLFERMNTERIRLEVGDVHSGANVAINTGAGASIDQSRGLQADEVALLFRQLYELARNLPEADKARNAVAELEQAVKEKRPDRFARLKQTLWDLFAKAGDATVQKVLERLFERLETGF